MPCYTLFSPRYLLFFFIVGLIPIDQLPSHAAQKPIAIKLTEACDQPLTVSPVYSLELNGGSSKKFKKYFNDLPIDQYLASKGAFFRYRRHSRFQINSKKLVVLPAKAFKQSKKINPLFANVPRTFEPLDPKLISLPSFKRLIETFSNSLPGKPAHYEIGVHQIRVIADPLNDIASATPVPEGRHKDGVDFIGIYVVSRSNVKGGITILSRTKHGEPIYQTQLEPGQLLVLNDRKYWHDATPIESSNGKIAIRDVFIFTAKRISTR